MPEVLSSAIIKMVLEREGLCYADEIYRRKTEYLFERDTHSVVSHTAGERMCKAELQGYLIFYRIVCSKAKTHKIQGNKFRKFKAKCGSHLLMKENILSENLD